MLQLAVNYDGHLENPPLCTGELPPKPKRFADPATGEMTTSDALPKQLPFTLVAEDCFDLRFRV